jgi:D-inositol-3-phosphate glycosyltransferase
MTSRRSPGRALRIALVSEHASPLAVLGGHDAGGQNVHVAELARALSRLGHSVQVFTRQDSSQMPARVWLAPGVEVVHVPAGPPVAVPKDDLLQWMPEFGDWLAAAWAADPPDVVHAHFWMSGVAALAAARELGLPVVQTFHALGSVKRRHQGTQDTSPPGRVDIEAAVARDVDAVLTTCSDEVHELEMMGVRADQRFHVVPCGVDTELFTPGPPPGPRPARSGSRRFRLLSVGRLVERKGFETIIRALPNLPDCDLVIAGGPAGTALAQDPEAVRLTRIAQTLGVNGQLQLVGSVGRGDMPRLLRSSDVVVATPWYEPFGIVPLEAAACGRPVVGSATGGLLDTIVPGLTGILIPPRDTSALALALRELLDNPTLRRNLGRAARRRAVARYSWRSVAIATNQVYREVVAGTVPTRLGAVAG